MKDNLIKEAENISNTIILINEQYKDTATKQEMVEFKNTILKALEELEGFKHSPYSIVRISTVDRIGTLKEYRKLIEDVLELDFEEGSIREFSLYKGNVWISFHNDVVEFWMLGDKEDDSLMVEVKDKIMDKLIKEFNAKKICLHTKLLDGYQNWEFFLCEKYVEPKETWFTKLAKVL